MTKKELKEHCERQIECCEMWTRQCGEKPHGKIYEEHKLILDLINELQDKSYELWKESYEEEHLRNIRLEEKIKALEQQPCEDCVSRQAVLDLAVDYGTNSATFLVPVCSVKSLPPVTPTQSWLPVSEKLPEESGNYLLYGKVVDYEENCVFIGEYDSDYEKFGYEENIYDSETLGFLDSEFCEYNKVIAWQPLPKPYEEKRGNENGSN